MTRHHPSGDLLTSYAAGGLGVGASLVVGSHAEHCAECRKEISLLNGLGGLLLAKSKSASLSEGALERALTRLDGNPPPMRTPKPLPGFLAGFGMPKRLRADMIGRRLWLAPGIWFAPVRAEPNTDARTFLLYGAEDKAFPRHTHAGKELTIVLKGAYTDDLGHFALGDFAEADESITHAQRVTDDGECLCLISSDGPMKIEGLTARLVQAYAGRRY